MQHEGCLRLVLLSDVYLEVSRQRIHADPDLALRSQLLSDLFSCGEDLELVPYEAIIKLGEIQHKT